MSKKFYCVLSTLLAASFQMNASVQSGSAFEISCRAKAKEMASDTYRSCVTEGRNAELDKVRKDYQERLRALKDDYEKDLEKIGGKQKTGKKQDSEKFVASTKSPIKKHLEPSAENETNIESSTSRNSSLPDESRMDIPEPIPVENIGIEKN